MVWRPKDIVGSKHTLLPTFSLGGGMGHAPGPPFPYATELVNFLAQCEWSPLAPLCMGIWSGHSTTCTHLIASYSYCPQAALADQHTARNMYKPCGTGQCIALELQIIQDQFVGVVDQQWETRFNLDDLWIGDR